MIEIASNGGTKSTQPNYLGLFQKNNGVTNSRAMYSKGSNIYLWWNVSPTNWMVRKVLFNS